MQNCGNTHKHTISANKKAKQTPSPLYIHELYTLTLKRKEKKNIERTIYATMDHTRLEKEKSKYY